MNPTTPASAIKYAVRECIRPSGAIRKITIRAVIPSGDATRAPAQPTTCPATTAVCPEPPGGQNMYASAATATDVPPMTTSSQPIGCDGYRDTINAPITAAPRVASGTIGQPCA